MNQSEAVFELKGVSHLAMVCADMGRTVDFYQGILGFPLVKTMELPGGEGQHFFFDVGNGDCLAFFWLKKVRPAAPGIAAPASLADWSAVGSMHHVAFKIDADRVDEYRAKLSERGVKYRWIAHSVDGSITAEITDDTYAASMYFQDPDGIVIEFCAWLPAYERMGVEHEPARLEPVR